MHSARDVGPPAANREIKIMSTVSPSNRWRKRSGLWRGLRRHVGRMQYEAASNEAYNKTSSDEAHGCSNKYQNDGVRARFG
jgi:hypothetical protein